MTPDQARALLDAHLAEHPLLPAQGAYTERDGWFVALVQAAYAQGQRATEAQALGAYVQGALGEYIQGLSQRATHVDIR